jgi:hypothetical protein
MHNRESQDTLNSFHVYFFSFPGIKKFEIVHIITISTPQYQRVHSSAKLLVVVGIFLPKMLSKQERIFAPQTLYNEGAEDILRKWHENFESHAPTRKHIYRLRDKFEPHGAAFGAPRSGRPRSVKIESCGAGKKASLQLDTARRSLRRILHEYKFKCCVPCSVHGLLEDNYNSRDSYEPVSRDPQNFQKIL